MLKRGNIQKQELTGQYSEVFAVGFMMILLPDTFLLPDKYHEAPGKGKSVAS